MEQLGGSYSDPGENGHKLELEKCQRKDVSAGEGGRDMIPRFLACARKVGKSRERMVWSMPK